jgi:hypothetical protein
MDTVSTLISLETIGNLPWQVGVPGMALIVLLLWSAVKSALTLRPFKALMRIAIAFIVAVILTQGGDSIAQMVVAPPPS